MRKLGKKNQGAVEPVEFQLESRPETVKELVEGLVCLGVRQYNERKDTGQIVPWLTSGTIQDQAAAGKISFGIRRGNDAEADQAVENAVQCFEDGIYRIFADEEELTELEQPVPQREGLRVAAARKDAAYSVAAVNFSQEPCTLEIVLPGDFAGGVLYRYTESDRACDANGFPAPCERGIAGKRFRTTVPAESFVLLTNVE